VIGLDTNVLVRYVVEDDQVQSKIAADFIERECSRASPGWINRIVLCEFVWVLARSYQFDREQIAEAIEGLLNSDDLVIESRDEVSEALAVFQGRHVDDFADALIAFGNLSSGCRATATFDRRAARMPNAFTLLSPA
jgi:predicted nucleic-acid-binding protein